MTVRAAGIRTSTARRSGRAADRMPTRGGARGPLRTALRTTGMLVLLTAALPANLAITAVALARSAVRPASREVPERRRTVLVSGGKMTKALQLCRSFHAAGHRVVLVEMGKYRMTGHRFSRAVDAFHTVPPPTDPGYADALLDIVRREGVDVYVPVCSPVASWYDAAAAEVLHPHCEVLHADADTVAMLDDKHAFARRAATLGLDVPDTHRVTSPAQVERFDFAAADGPYVLKHLAYDPVNRLDLSLLPRQNPSETAEFARSKAMAEDDPWILQQFVRGTEYGTHSTVRDGRVVVHACCRSSPFQINYEAVDHPRIERWVRAFVEPLGITGQVSLDLIVEDGGRVVAIECNPRTHSAITMFHDHPGLAAAYLGELPPDADPVTPLPGSRPTYWLYHELWRLACEPGRRERWRVIRHGKDAIFSWDDPLPFLMVHHLHIPVLLLRSLIRGTDWLRVDLNIGKLVEVGGD
ncbi:MAG: hypothetical protein ACRCXL_13905 [Dermatophilaceae bacterium]